MIFMACTPATIVYLLVKPVRTELESCDLMIDDPLVYFTYMVSV